MIAATRRIWLGLAGLMGIGAIANGLIMLASPVSWYFAVPGVTSTGPFNQHFIRDIGLIFVGVGAAFLAGAVRADLRVILWSGAAAWLSGHALFHFWEVAVGICSSSAITRDFPAVTTPALLAIGLTTLAALDGKAQASSAR